MRSKKKLQLRVISTILCLTFASTEARAAAFTASTLSDPMRLEVPAEHAVLSDLHPGSNGSFIIHIQDAHSNVSGQENIAEALRFVMDRYDVRLVLSEGGYGDCSLTPLKKIAPTNTWSRVARRFLITGQIQAEEYLNLTSDLPMKIVGIEDKALYEKGLEAYRLLTERREASLSYLETVRRAVDKVQSKIYPRDIYEYERAKESRLLTQADFAALSVLANVHRVELDSYPQVVKLLDLQEDEKKIDFQAAEMEQAALAEALSEKGGESLETYLERAKKSRASRVAQYSFTQGLLDLAQAKGVDTVRYVDLAAYHQYLKKFSRIDMEALTEEMRLLEEAVYTRSLDDADSKLLRSIDRYLSLLEAALRIRMTSAQYELWRANASDFTMEPIQAFLNRKLVEHGYADEIISYEPMLNEGRGAVEDFYASVQERDLAFLRNAEDALDREDAKIAVLISGGYHTAHLTELLRGKGYGYAVLMPHVAAGTSQKKYERLLLEDRSSAKSTVKLENGTAVARKKTTTLDKDLEKIINRKSGTIRKSLAVLNGLGADGDLFQVAEAASPGSGARLSDLFRAVSPETSPDAPQGARMASFNWDKPILSIKIPRLSNLFSRKPKASKAMDPGFSARAQQNHDRFLEVLLDTPRSKEMGAIEAHVRDAVSGLSSGDAALMLDELFVRVSESAIPYGIRMGSTQPMTPRTLALAYSMLHAIDEMSESTDLLTKAEDLEITIENIEDDSQMALAYLDQARKNVPENARKRVAIGVRQAAEEGPVVVRRLLAHEIMHLLATQIDRSRTDLVMPLEDWKALFREIGYTRVWVPVIQNGETLERWVDIETFLTGELTDVMDRLTYLDGKNFPEEHLQGIDPYWLNPHEYVAWNAENSGEIFDAKSGRDLTSRIVPILERNLLRSKDGQTIYAFDPTTGDWTARPAQGARLSDEDVQENLLRWGEVLRDGISGLRIAQGIAPLRQELDLLANAARSLTQNSLDAGAQRIGVDLVMTDAGALRLTLTDDGRGIAEKDLSRLFRERFSTKSPGQATLGWEGRAAFDVLQDLSRRTGEPARITVDTGVVGSSQRILKQIDVTKPADSDLIQTYDPTSAINYTTRIEIEIPIDGASGTQMPLYSSVWSARDMAAWESGARLAEPAQGAQAGRSDFARYMIDRAQRLRVSISVVENEIIRDEQRIEDNPNPTLQAALPARLEALEALRRELETLDRVLQSLKGSSDTDGASEIERPGGARLASAPYDVDLIRLNDSEWTALSGRGRRQYRVVQVSGEERGEMPSVMSQSVALLGEFYTADGVDQLREAIRSDSEEWVIAALMEGEQVVGAYEFNRRTLRLSTIIVKPAYRGTGAVDVLFEDMKERLLGGSTQTLISANILRLSDRVDRDPDAGTLVRGTLSTVKAGLGVISRVRISDGARLAENQDNAASLFKEIDQIRDRILSSEYKELFLAARNYEEAEYAKDDSMNGDYVQIGEGSPRFVSRSRGWTIWHEELVVVEAVRLGRAMGLSESDLLDLALAAMVHDIGKTRTPYQVMNWPAKLNAEQMLIMQRHAADGIEILKQMGYPEKIIEIVSAHHERMDGRGYPAGRTAERLSLAGRILAVADAFTALKESRHYRQIGWTREQAFSIIKAGQGSSYDPQVVAVLERTLSESSSPAALPVAADRAGARLSSGNLADERKVLEPQDAVQARIAASELVRDLDPFVKQMEDQLLTLEGASADPAGLSNVIVSAQELLEKLRSVDPTERTVQSMVRRTVSFGGPVARYDIANPAAAIVTIGKFTKTLTPETLDIFRHEVATIRQIVTLLTSFAAARMDVVSVQNDGHTFIDLEASSGARLSSQVPGSPLDREAFVQAVLKMDPNAQRIISALLSALLAEKTQNAALRNQAITDALTGLKTRRFFDEVAPELFSLSARYGFPVSVLAIDLDHFKSINDRFGHGVGDQVLRYMATVLTQLVDRQSDLLMHDGTWEDRQLEDPASVRWGGEEFLVILPGTNLTNASLIARRIQLVLDSGIYLDDHFQGSVPEGLVATASIGVAEFRPSDETPEALIARADAALYEAKKAGRNTVRVASGARLALTSGQIISRLQPLVSSPGSPDSSAKYFAIDHLPAADSQEPVTYAGWKLGGFQLLEQAGVLVLWQEERGSDGEVEQAGLQSIPLRITDIREISAADYAAARPGRSVARTDTEDAPTRPLPAPRVGAEERRRAEVMGPEESAEFAEAWIARAQEAGIQPMVNQAVQDRQEDGVARQFISPERLREGMISNRYVAIRVRDEDGGAIDQIVSKETFERWSSGSGARLADDEGRQVTFQRDQIDGFLKSVGDKDGPGKDTVYMAVERELTPMLRQIAEGIMSYAAEEGLPSADIPEVLSSLQLIFTHAAENAIDGYLQRVYEETSFAEPLDLMFELETTGEGFRIRMVSNGVRPSQALSSSEKMQAGSRYLGGLGMATVNMIDPVSMVMGGSYAVSDRSDIAGSVSTLSVQKEGFRSFLQFNRPRGARLASSDESWRETVSAMPAPSVIVSDFDNTLADPQNQALRSSIVGLLDRWLKAGSTLVLATIRDASNVTKRMEGFDADLYGARFENDGRMSASRLTALVKERTALAGDLTAQGIADRVMAVARSMGMVFEVDRVERVPEGDPNNQDMDLYRIRTADPVVSKVLQILVSKDMSTNPMAIVTFYDHVRLGTDPRKVFVDAFNDRYPGQFKLAVSGTGSVVLSLLDKSDRIRQMIAEGVPAESILYLGDEFEEYGGDHPVARLQQEIKDSAGKTLRIVNVGSSVERLNSVQADEFIQPGDRGVDATGELLDILVQRIEQSRTPAPAGEAGLAENGLSLYPQGSSRLAKPATNTIVLSEDPNGVSLLAKAYPLMKRARNAMFAFLIAGQAVLVTPANAENAVDLMTSTGRAVQTLDLADAIEEDRLRGALGETAGFRSARMTGASRTSQPREEFYLNTEAVIREMLDFVGETPIEYEGKKTVEFRVLTPKGFTGAQKAEIERWARTVERAMGGARIFVKFGTEDAPFLEEPGIDYKTRGPDGLLANHGIVYLGLMSKALIDAAAAANAGVGSTPEDAGSDGLSAAFGMMIFHATLQRLNVDFNAAPPEILERMWANLSESGSRLSGNYLNLMRRANNEQRLFSTYKKLMFRVAKVAWESALEMVRSAITATGISA